MIVFQHKSGRKAVFVPDLCPARAYACRKHIFCSTLPTVCLSRACLGKVISLWYQIAPKEGVFHPHTQGEGWLAGSLARLVRAAGARGHLESAWLRTRSCPRRSSLARVQSIDRGPTGPRSRTAS
jgi:hypothetical protein